MPPMIRFIRTMAMAAGALCLAAGGLLAGVALVLTFARPAVVAEPVEAAGGIVFTPGAVPASERVIEVVDSIPDPAWRVRAATVWLDQFTGSRMTMVGKCSGKAYRCITVKAGKVKGAPSGWSSGQTITIDTGKAKKRGYDAADRKWLLAHELGHQFGLKHSGGRHLMNPYEGRGALKLTSGQRRDLGKR